ncbi:hypothetical protein [Amycolatopsis sp. WQ 127309]|uniref:hypothetical protein n=1 Tax=Amycolatopsis sp. WQ 127309 TaxID=2932773 RepID=UPI001FF3553E|nr:hypothetical protein [Amycolatopsis sp. WQ 127309]UOZ10528.1 hypothetical protein MUY22_20595 [Amycolatopsis sp. WQ 127309]
MAGELDMDEFERLATEALERNECVTHEDVILIPDVVMMELMANGPEVDVPRMTFFLRRQGDERAVYLFRVPPGFTLPA